MNGVYYRYSGFDCDNRDVYKHAHNEIYMFHIGGFWCVHYLACTYDAHEHGYLLANDWSQYPEYILINTWMENNGGSWIANYDADVDCHSKYHT